MKSYWVVVKDYETEKTPVVFNDLTSALEEIRDWVDEGNSPHRVYLLKGEYVSFTVARCVSVTARGMTV